MLSNLEKVIFLRSVKPENVDPKVLPDIITFCDGNPDAFGAVCYVLWTLLDGSKKASLLISKAKLGPLQYKGETSRNELAAATFASRLKCWVIENTGLKFGKHVPFLDSMIVRDMIRKESYGYNTYAGLRVAEIQKKSDVDQWKHIPNGENIADVLTKGTKPDKLGPKSAWQCGPDWLVKSESEWPVTTPVLTTEEHETIHKYENAGTKKAQSFIAAAVSPRKVLWWII